MKNAAKKKPRPRKSSAPREVKRVKARAASTDTGLDATVIDASPVGIVAIGHSGQLTRINPAALEVFDINRDSIPSLGSSRKAVMFLDLLPEREQARWQYMINLVMSTRDSYCNDRFFHNTGYVEKVLSVRISPVTTGQDSGPGLVITVEDVTNSVLMEKYLILSEKLVAKGELATSIAHELNTHLDAALRHADLLPLQIEQNQSDKVKTSCGTISQSVSKMRHFVDNLVDFSKPQTEYISYDIKHLIEDLLFSLRIQPRFRQTHFTIDLSSDIPNLDIDVGQIQQVFTNVLNNAADAIEERAIEHQKEGCELKREIEIQASYDRISDTVMVDISDNGVGMPEGTIEQIFDMYFSTKKSGHGLGLYNCRKIVEQHNGDISAQSTYGEGSTFRITLPRTQPHTN
ncbi:MAG: GHKL domain-containing protein [Candidatus Zixiibacteriota bacterium]|nr:MAG: GHKL domain-containing protein [candidate division Zixibacteria bacterium]